MLFTLTLVSDPTLKDLLNGLRSQTSDVKVVITAPSIDILTSSKNEDVWIHSTHSNVDQDVDMKVDEFTASVDLKSITSTLADCHKNKWTPRFYAKKQNELHIQGIDNHGQIIKDTTVQPSAMGKFGTAKLNFNALAKGPYYHFSMDPRLLEFLNINIAIASGLCTVKADKSVLEFKVKCDSGASTTFKFDVPGIPDVLGDIVCKAKADKPIVNEFFGAALRRMYKMFDHKCGIDFIVTNYGCCIRIVYKPDISSVLHFFPNIRKWQKDTYK